MPYVLMRHKVRLGGSKPVYGAHCAAQSGFNRIRLFRTAYSPSESVIHLDRSDLDYARGLIEPEDPGQSVATAGVSDRANLCFVNEAELSDA